MIDRLPFFFRQSSKQLSRYLFFYWLFLHLLLLLLLLLFFLLLLIKHLLLKLLLLYLQHFELFLFPFSLDHVLVLFLNQRKLSLFDLLLIPLIYGIFLLAFLCPEDALQFYFQSFATELKELTLLDGISYDVLPTDLEPKLKSSVFRLNWPHIFHDFLHLSHQLKLLLLPDVVDDASFNAALVLSIEQ